MRQSSTKMPIPCSLLPIPYSLFPCSLLPAPCSLLPIPCSLLPAPCSLLPIPCSLLPAPCSLLPAPCSLLPLQKTLVAPWVSTQSDRTTDEMPSSFQADAIAAATASEFTVSVKAKSVGPAPLMTIP